ncbi:hypothetical protein GCM10010306_005260 [Streptomyces umbrinus]|nr:hypothetical protein GCM10010306_005260 [Streptomyces umbrinus]GHH45807.1 hypothetical protein GCM10018775_36130 [Streptomyces umbrinus]
MYLGYEGDEGLVAVDRPDGTSGQGVQAVLAVRESRPGHLPKASISFSLDSSLPVRRVVER